VKTHLCISEAAKSRYRNRGDQEQIAAQTRALSRSVDLPFAVTQGPVAHFP